MSLIDPDTLHRTAKLELDEGRVTTVEDAIAVASRYILQIDVGPQIASSATMQAMLLTAVNAGARAFLGGVRVRAAINPVLTTRWAAGRTLCDAVTVLGGLTVTELVDAYPTLVIGDITEPLGQPVLHLTWNGWTAAAVTNKSDRLPENQEFPLAGVLGGALGVSETFQYIRGSTRTGFRNVGLSLWQPAVAWQDPMAAGPKRSYLPQRLFVAGLGHLGQAICWALGFLPYPEADSLDVTLQDFDKIIDANLSTGLLSAGGDLGSRKTRVVATKLEQIGFTTAIIERRIDDNTYRTVDEPNWAFACFDQPEPRRALVNAGFNKIIDLGLGSGPRDYLDILLHVFPSGLRPDDAWPIDIPSRLMPPSYENLVQRQVASGIDEGTARCGLIDLAGRSVAAAFVGASAAALAIAEALRELLGGASAGVPSYEIISLPLTNPTQIDPVSNRHIDLIDNPGFIKP